MSSSDWDLGQKLIEQGACSLDQVREILSLQDRLRKMGAVPKPFARVLLEKGYARRDQLLGVGVREADLPPPVEQKASTAPRVPVPAPARSGARPLAWGAVLLAAAAGLILVGRGVFEEGVAPSPVHVPEVVPAVTRESIDAAAPAEIDALVRFARESSGYENAPEAVRRFEAYKKLRAGTQWEVEAHRRLTEYRKGLEVYAKSELDELLAAEPTLAGQKRWGELLALYRAYPAKFLETTESGAGLKRKVQEVSQRIAEVYARDKAELERFLVAKRFAEALARVHSMEASAPEERKGELLGLRARIERESRGVAERARQEVADAYFKIDGAFKQAMLRRDPVRAAAVVREFISAPWKEDQRPFVTVRGVDYAALYKAFDPWDPGAIAGICEEAIPEVDSPDRLGTGEGALLALRNAAYLAIFLRDESAQYHAATSTHEVLDLPGLGRGRFEKRDGKTVFIANSGAVLEPETSPLTDPDLAALAMMVGPETAAMHARVGFFYFYSSPSMAHQAYEHLARACALYAPGVKLFLGGLAEAAEGERRRELETKFGAAQDLFKSRNWAQSKKLLGDLLEFPDHPYTLSVRPEIERMLYEIAEGSEKEKRLAVRYKAKVEEVDPATLRATYDFEGKDQLDAFESVTEEGPRKFKGRWRIDRGAMESSADASVMRWKPVVMGDVTLEYDLTPVDEAQNIVVDLYYHRGAARHYAVVLGFDWVGRQDGDRDNSAEERFGMPRTCVIKYPVQADKSRWTSADAWDGWKSRLAGKPAAPWKPAKGRTARMRIERIGPLIRLLADRVLVWEGQDDEYGEGQLLFYSDSRCRMDNLVITFKPQS